MVPQIEIGPREKRLAPFNATELLSLPEASNDFKATVIKAS
jgi:hypothetical protein